MPPDLRDVGVWESLKDAISSSQDVALYDRLLKHLQFVETSPSFTRCQIRAAREQLWHDLQTFNARHAQETPSTPIP